jgi:hypothetical protein
LPWLSVYLMEVYGAATKEQTNNVNFYFFKFLSHLEKILFHKRILAFQLNHTRLDLDVLFVVNNCNIIVISDGLVYFHLSGKWIFFFFKCLLLLFFTLVLTKLYLFSSNTLAVPKCFQNFKNGAYLTTQCKGNKKTFKYKYLYFFTNCGTSIMHKNNTWYI